MMPSPSPSPLPPRWDLTQYRALLRMIAWQLHLDPRMQRRFDGSDVVQKALMLAHQGLNGFQGTTEAELIAWLKEILHNTFRTFVRIELAKQRSPEFEASLEEVINDSSVRVDRLFVASNTSPSNAVERKEFLLRWANAVEQLPAAQRNVVLLRDLHGLPIKHIADQLNQTEKAVAGHLLRGRRNLRSAFPDYQQGQ